MSYPFVIAILVISLALLLFYTFLFGYFRKGWQQLPGYEESGGADQNHKAPSENISFSILIPARNEEKNILACLQGIINQDYPSTHFEVIVLDDHSEDKTSDMINNFIQNHSQFSMRLIRMQDQPSIKNSYKKAAISLGVELSKYDWIITSDADCTRGKNWLKTIAGFIIEKDPVFISAPVAFNYNKSFFQQAQALEFLGLIGIGAACISMGNPILANGANIVYRKSAFLDVEGFKNIDAIASGDDELLMHKMHNAFPGGIHFLKSSEAIVYTRPCNDAGEFIRQRKRWVSKSTHYSNKKITLILMMSYLFNLGILVALVFSFFKPTLFFGFLFLSVIKILIEYSFYRKILGFFGESRLLRWCIPASMLHIVYVLFIGIYGNFGSYNWKGRKVR